MSDYLKIHPQPCQCPFCESERRWAKKQSELASALLLAAHVVVNQDLVDEIVTRAKASEYGLGDPEKKPDITQYQPWDIDMLALCLVSSWTDKYDLVSVFSAAMSVIQERAANNKISDPEL